MTRSNSPTSDAAAPDPGSGRSTRHPRGAALGVSQSTERMWPLDLSIAALAALVLYLVVNFLRFDDPRLLHNGWTYVIAVPLIALGLAVLSHRLVARHVQKSLQLGFLFSVFVHLLLLLLAVNVVIFSRYFPRSFTGSTADRSPIRQTVPEYLFKTQPQNNTTPDWSQPVDATTSSRIPPEELQQLPPLERTAPRLEIPKLREPEQRPLQKFLVERQQPTESIPKPIESPARLAQRRPAAETASPAATRPTAPDAPVEADVQAESIAREAQRRQRPASASASLPPAPRASDIANNPPEPPSFAGVRRRSESLPQIGEAGLRREFRASDSDATVQPVGSAPPPPSVAVAIEDVTADMMAAPMPEPITRQGKPGGAQLAMDAMPQVGMPENQAAQTGGAFARSEIAARRGMPSVNAGTSPRAPGRDMQRSSGDRFQPLGVPDSSPSVAVSQGESSSEPRETAADRLGSDVPTRTASTRRGGSVAAELPNNAAEAIELDSALPHGLAGLAPLRNGAGGIVPSPEDVEIAMPDLTRGVRPRREVGGPVTPAGNKVAAVESFQRRVMRTRGGATPSPAGMVGPATEEAIERGLVYLASTQNEDGGWSLQGHGTEVVLLSDTAATGLCLLAFQGAGYTHRQHQYADTVSRGLNFLIDQQKPSGDLYQSENQISDRNVALYSHGIAALALCEAYGMTQDPELEEPAQACLNYIINTQHRTRGGWRYTPQVSADTSVTGWMMMALKSGELAGLEVPPQTYAGIEKWLELAQSPERPDRYRYNPFAPDTPTQRHGRLPTPTMTSVGMLMRMYTGWQRDNPEMQSAADYLLQYPPQIGTATSPQRDTYYWYYATQVMFHMGGEHWYQWNRSLNPILVQGQIKNGPYSGSWDPMKPVPDRWSVHAGRLYVTTMNLLNLEVFYRHLPIYEEAGGEG